MTASRGRPPVLASDAWMLEQQIRAEMEAEAWRRLREDMAAPPALPPPVANAEPVDHHTAGSIVLKAIVRFALATFGAYCGWLAAVDAGLGEFEIWLATGSGFAITLALSMFGYARELVHVLAETARWALIAALAVGAVWMLFQVA
jgi:hypothetical protein